MHKQVFRVNGNLCRVKRKGKGFYEIKALIKGNLYVFKVDVIAKDDELKLYDVDLDKISIWSIEALAQNGFGVYVDEGKPFSTEDYRKPLTTVVDSPVFIKLDNQPIEGIEFMENVNETKETEEKVVDITTLNVVEKQPEEPAKSVKEVEPVVETKSETVEEQVEDTTDDIIVEPDTTTEPVKDKEESSLSAFSVWGNRVMKTAVIGATGYLLYRTVKYIMED